MAALLKPNHFHDLGKLMFAFVMLWAYFNFSQYLLDLRGEPGRRNPVHDHAHQPRLAVPGAVPDHCSTSRCRGCCCCRATSSARRTGWSSIALWLLFVRFADLYMMVSPEFASSGANLHLVEGEHVSHFFVHWLDLAAPLAIGGLWLWMFFTELRQRPLLAVGDPYLREVARKRQEATDGARIATHVRDTPARAGRRVPRHAAGDGARAHRRQRLDHRQVRVLAGGVRDRHPRRHVAACSGCSSSRARTRPSREFPLAGAGAAAAGRRRGCSSSRRTRSSSSARREDAVLNGYGWVNKEAGVVRIPIAEAMRLTVERGLPSRAAATPERSRRRRAGLMPADSSAGGRWKEEGSRRCCNHEIQSSKLKGATAARRWRRRGRCRALCIVPCALRAAHAQQQPGMPGSMGHRAGHRRRRTCRRSSRT